jgi:hypothetical protein
MLAHGSNEDRQVIIIPPFFEEMNFTRIFLADVARAMAERGTGSRLIDLPGTGESLRDLEDVDWQDWRDAARIAGETIAGRAGRKPHIVAIRGGALLSDAIDGLSSWSLAPIPGAALLRDLRRTQLISDSWNNQHTVDIEDKYSYAGYALSPAMHDGLNAAIEPASPVPHRTAPPDLHGSDGLLWRRAEPGRNQALSVALAEDIVAWIATCEHR